MYDDGDSDISESVNGKDMLKTIKKPTRRSKPKVEFSELQGGDEKSNKHVR